MSGNILSADQIRKGLSDPQFLSGNIFQLLRSLCALHNQDENKSIFQELVLRALDKREAFDKYAEILNSLVREVGLFPYLNPEELGFADRLAYEYHRPLHMEEQDIVFHRPQAYVYRELMQGRSVILSAPPSFGKSLIIDAIVASGKFKNILIIVPTIALIDETRRRLSSLNTPYKIITHVFQEPSSHNIFVLTQERALELRELEPIEFFVIDEFYKLSPGQDNEDRSSLLNQIFYKLIKSRAQFYMLGPGINGISQDTQERIECTWIYEPYNTVVSEVYRVRSRKNEYEALAELCKSLHGSTIIFCQSPKRASEVAKALIDLNVGNWHEGLKNAVEWMGREYHRQWHFARALEQGIGIHHGRIPRALSQFIVRAFNEERIKYLICTSTLIEGVNTKAENVIIFDNKINRQKYDYFTFNNIKGRSGRMFQHYIGRVYLFHDPPYEELPFIDIPAISQPADTPESLLIQLEEEDLTSLSRERLQDYQDQNILSFSTLKNNVGIDLDAQLQVAKAILSNISFYSRMLNWRSVPTYNQLLAICNLIWRYFDGKNLGARSARSAKQLAVMLRQLEQGLSIKRLILNQMEFTRKPDDAVSTVLDFIRLWPGFHFPRLLRAINFIQADIFQKRGILPGNFEQYAHRVENLFLDPAIVALDEYGIPIQLARKLEKKLKPNGNLDSVLAQLKELDINNLSLLPFEIELLLDAQASIPNPVKSKH